jgi:hypothetical protein
MLLIVYAARQSGGSRDGCADGTNEVMGIQPDVLVGLRTTDGPHRQGIRVAKRLPEAVASAIQMRGARS